MKIDQVIEPSLKPWRKNVGACLIDETGRVLLGEKKRNSGFWQFPQGGVDHGENLELALSREVFEEVGIHPRQYQYDKVLEGLRYPYESDHFRFGIYQGQQQTFYRCRFTGDPAKVTTQHGDEFVRLRWFSLSDLKLSHFPPNKRAVAARVLHEFTDYEAQIGLDLSGKLAELVKASQPKDRSVSERYIVRPGEGLDLSKIDSRDRALFDGSKSSSLQVFDELRDEIQFLQKKLFAQNKHKILLIIQAMDTGGKDGVIKHVFSRVDPQGVDVASFKKPTEEELARDFLWRVHQRVPRNGMITVFNRSHYEDIIAVRVKKLFGDEVWQRRYQHVIDFERMLVEEGTMVIKIFLHISKEEQKERLVSRLENPQKHWKFHPDDLEDRGRWSEFEDAYSDLIAKTSTDFAPWYVIPADRKWYRNLAVARLFLEHLDDLELKFPDVDFDPSEIQVGD